MSRLFVVLSSTLLGLLAGVVISIKATGSIQQGAVMWCSILAFGLALGSEDDGDAGPGTFTRSRAGSRRALRRQRSRAVGA